MGHEYLSSLLGPHYFRESFFCLFNIVETNDIEIFAHGFLMQNGFHDMFECLRVLCLTVIKLGH